MTERDHRRTWDDVDATDDPGAYADYLETLTGEETVRAYKRRSHRLLDPAAGDRILDAGCGAGQDAAMLADLVGPEGAVVGVDDSERMVEAARERGSDVPPVQFAVDDVQDLSFPDDAFDAARADRVLQHLAAPDEAFGELQRVTRPGGRVGVSDPDWATAIVDTPEGHSEAFLSLEHACPRNPTTGRQLCRLATDAGLVDLDVDTWTLVTTEFGFLREAAELDGWTDAMRAAGEATETEIEEWFEGLRRADERDALFASITGFTVVGTVPERDASAE